MKQTMPELIIEYLSQKRNFVIKGDIIEYCKQRTGKYPESLGRTCRHMVSDGRLDREEKTINGKRLAYYKLKETRTLEETYQPKVAKQMRLENFERINGLGI